jgi:anti-sigma regulatory factor (Ser/Thr protein kinase)
MPDHTIHLTLPADADLAPVASVAVRAAARQVALPESEIDRLRTAVVAALEALVEERPDRGDIEVVLHPGKGSLEVTLDGRLVG